MPTTGYQAGLETNNTQLSYAVEATWGTAPATTFQALRYTSETLTGSKTRNRPGEINPTREATQATTTQESASGDVNFALSYGTYDDFLATALGNAWQAPQTIAGVAADITLTNLTSTTATLSSGTANKFLNLNLGQWIRLLGFTNAINNGFFRVTAKASNTSLTLATPGGSVITETPTGTLAQVRASTIQNGTAFQSLYLQQKYSSALWLRYPGAFASAFSLSGGVGQFLSGKFTLLAQQETSATADVSTGGVNAAPTGGVHDPVGGFGGVYVNETKVAATVDSFTINVANTGAAQQYGMGSSASQGVMMGTLEVTGTVKLFFKDFTYYTRFKNETLGAIEFITKDPSGNAYVITLPNAALMNPQIQAGGPGQAVYSSFSLEGNPQSAGGTIIIDRLPSV